MNTQINQRRVVIANEKITKGEIDKTLAEGKTHVKFKNKGVQKRMMKQQGKIRRQQELRENQVKIVAKTKEAAKTALSSSNGIGLTHPVESFVKSGDAHFINKGGKRVIVSAKEAAEVVKAFEATHGDEEASANEEEDLTGAAGPEYSYRQQDEAMELYEHSLRADISVALVASPKVGEDGILLGQDAITDAPAVNMPDGFKLTDPYGAKGVIVSINTDPSDKLEESALAASILSEHSDVRDLTPFPMYGGCSSRTMMYQAGLADSITKAGTEALVSEIGLMPGVDKAVRSEAFDGLFHVTDSPKAHLPQVILGANQAFVNLYGDENNYKPLPNIGDLVRDDGLVAAVRTFTDDPMPVYAELATMRDVNYVLDRIQYASPGATVVDTPKEAEPEYLVLPSSGVGHNLQLFNHMHESPKEREAQVDALIKDLEAIGDLEKTSLYPKPVVTGEEGENGAGK